jgi:microcystin-dependent protein
MSDPYTGEIRLFPYPSNRQLVNWQACDGSLLKISDNPPLYALLGILYGGDGTTTFGVPDLRGRVPIGAGQGTGLQNYALAAKAGGESVSLTAVDLPPHTHSLAASTAAATTPTPTGMVLAAAASEGAYWSGTGATVQATFDPTSVQTAGTGLPHDNMMPSLPINFYICTNGIFPSPS